MMESEADRVQAKLEALRAELEEAEREISRARSGVLSGPPMGSAVEPEPGDEQPQGRELHQVIHQELRELARVTEMMRRKDIKKQRIAQALSLTGAIMVLATGVLLSLSLDNALEGVVGPEPLLVIGSLATALALGGMVAKIRIDTRIDQLHARTEKVLSRFRGEAGR